MATSTATATMSRSTSNSASATEEIQSCPSSQQQQQQSGEASTSTKTTPCQASQDAMKKPCKNNSGWRRIVRNFTPSWFAVTMGTGIVSILLHNLPYNATWLQYISYVFFGLNVLLFTVFTIVSILRYTMYPEIWGVMIVHPAQSLFLGCFPMGFATIINMMIFCCQSWGTWLVHLAWAFWWIDVLLSMATCISMPFIVMHRHKPGLQNTTAALLLPIVPAVVAAATGGVVAEALPDPNHALTTVVTSYVLWGIGQALSACVLALYFHRLTIHSLPPREVIVSVFLPVGPLGQGGFGIQQLGKVALHRFGDTNVFRIAGLDPARGAEVLYVLGVFFGLVMWGFALTWVAFALISLATTQRFPFNMGWWGFTFPLGVWGTCTGQLAANLDSDFFKVATTIISLAVLLLWIMVASQTVKMAIKGDMFFAPCLKSLAQEPPNPAETKEKA